MEIAGEFNPKVSIVIPVYNGSNFLREAIDSALAQTYKNVEVIVVNDGSDDSGKTKAIAASYGDSIRYFCKENGGVASALNMGIREMRGEYFSWLSHDDVYYPNKIEVQINYLKNHKKEEVILYSDYEFIDYKSRFLRKKIIKNVDPEKFLLALIVSCPVHGCTTLIPQKCFTEIGLFDESLKTAQDYDMWFRMAKRFKFIQIPQILLKSRVHPHQGSVSMQNFATECNNLIKKCLLDLSAKEISRFTNEPLSLFYLKVAIKLKIFLFDNASEFALALSEKNKETESWLIFLQRTALTAFYRILNQRLNPRYWVRRLRRLKNTKIGAENEDKYNF
jgi:glycosyltransferase involved in cell wall biosynthesis